MARVFVLGLNAWLVTLALPTMLASPRSVLAFALLVVPLFPLGVGILTLHWSRVLATWLLLGGFPMVVAAVAAGLPNLANRSPWSTPGLVVAVLSMIAFGAGAAWSVGRPIRIRNTSHKPLGSVAPIERDPRRTLLRRGLLAATVLGALCIAVVAPGVGGTPQYEADWGAAAPEAAVLATVVGGALGASALALFLGPSLRASRARPPKWRHVRRRVAGLLFSVAVGVAFYLFYMTSGS